MNRFEKVITLTLLGVGYVFLSFLAAGIYGKTHPICGVLFAVGAGHFVGVFLCLSRKEVEQ